MGELSIGDAQLFSKQLIAAKLGLGHSTAFPVDNDVVDAITRKCLDKDAALEEARIFRTALEEQLIRNGHSEELRNMSEFELIGYIVNALGGVVLQ